MSLIQTAGDAAKQLNKIAAQKAELETAVRKKTDIRQSEKAMWLTDIAADRLALAIAVDVLGGKPIAKAVSDWRGSRT